ncbi:regulator of telomere elongation helicase 1-like [Mya arenaria]|uniref:regulator of telomere elongation helicase 1-like n=1 Tax=Mya arenaria TaxID=6604 RepID=UPI0022E451EA|nr:regulator of telomere elongation helicase 1-like [Mya arenaria]XP_052775213.1 regulator of telomere elongation helicase 1-like [Mya arenaria]XP_052775214.1 regulator of telomere elongation helicase 1-like [Mya arenaria]
MPLLDVHGVQVNFPFEPYPCQLDYMNKVIECLQKDVNGVLESPTGTGKTLCLLCSSLAWQETRKAQTEFNKQVSVSQLLGPGEKGPSDRALEGLAKSLEGSTGTSWGGSDFAVPKIIYASRTHSQLSQVIQELKRTAYNTVKVSVIGSRDQLCIHEQVKKEQSNTGKVHMCRAKVNSRTCYYYNHLDDLKKNSEPRVLTGNVVDIEDLVNYGQKNKVCPYYMARELKADADIIFMPYNYLLDPKTRKAHGVELQGNVVIFDEAHNLEKICEDSSSFDMKAGDLATAIEEMSRLGEKFVELIQTERSEEDLGGPEAMPDFTLDDILRLKSTLVDFEKVIDEVNVPSGGKGLTKPGMFIYELLGKANIVYSNKNIIVDMLEKIVGYITADASGSGAGISKGVGLNKVLDVLKIIFSQDVPPGSSLLEHQEKLAKSYKVHLQKDDGGKKKKQMDLWTNSSAQEKMGKTLSYWCFSPGHSMSDLLAHGIKCIVLTSGTLSPLDSFTAEMQIPFPVRLENPHVIQKHQVWVGTLKKGPDGTTLNSNFETRFTVSYQAALGNSIVNFAREVPNGLLIFFPSYPVMEKCLEQWKESNIWSRIEQYKQIFVESRAKGVLNDLMNDFYSKINDPSLNGAIFIAVCRGKVSEGLDFSDTNGRAVVITGLPYPPYMDPKVVLKMQYLDEMKGKQGFQSLSGKEWYRQQASRAVNQAIGRVIRHKDDFGAIILCDTRFSNNDSIKQLPVWVRPRCNKYEAFGLAVRDLMVFFKHAEKLMPTPGANKKQSRSSSTGGGAYFLPTATRTGSGEGPSSAHPAHFVQQHVPSLKHRENVVTNEKLQQHYSGGSMETSSRSQKSLFSALDQTEKFQEPAFSPAQLQTDQTAGIDFRKPGTKRKIIIKKRDGDVTEKETKAAVSSKQLNTAENYISEVKASLGKESSGYKQFSSALVQYKKSEDIESVCNVITEVFVRQGHFPQLFAKFYRFVRPKHKERFSELCQQITGLSTGYKTEDSVSRKRLQETELGSGAFKKQKTDSDDMKNSKEGAKTVSLEKTNHVKSSSSYDKENGGTVKASASSDKSGCLSKVSTQTTINTSKSTGKPGSTSKTVPCIRASLLPAMEAQEPSNAPVSGYTCCKCSQMAKVPFRAMCDHICCMACWRDVFLGTKLCPSCQSGVRRRHLVQLIFPADQSQAVDGDAIDGSTNTDGKHEGKVRNTTGKQTFPTGSDR